MTQKKTSAVSIIALCDILNDHGISAADVEKRTGIVRREMFDTDARITIEQFLDLWQLAVDVTGDPALGLHLRENYGTEIMHFVIRIALNSRNVLEAVSAWARYAMLICEIDQIDIIEEEDTYTFIYTNTDPEYANRWLPEHHLSLAISYGKQFLPKPVTPLEVWFRHPDPGYREEYENTFRCPVFFNKPENLCRVKKEDMLQPILSPDPYLRAILEKHAVETFEKYHSHDSVITKVRSHIFRNLHTGSISSETVSEALNMDRSTLYRHLKKEGVIFKEILTQVRQELAKKHLSENLTVSQTAYLLGFSEPSTFQRAFKVWFGISPGEYRKQL